MSNRDLDQVAVVALIQRDAGGNAAEVIDQVAENVRTRQELRRLARTLTAQGRMARWILTALPIGVFVMLLLINKEYLVTTLGDDLRDPRVDRLRDHGHDRVVHHQAHRGHQGLRR